jgi:hypothetical protein
LRRGACATVRKQRNRKSLPRIAASFFVFLAVAPRSKSLAQINEQPRAQSAAQAIAKFHAPFALRFRYANDPNHAMFSLRLLLL